MTTVFTILLDDLASGEPILQKAALFKISRLDSAAFQRVAKMIVHGGWSIEDRILDVVFEIQKRRGLAEKEGREEPSDIQNFGSKTLADALADWTSADVRIKLAMLKQAAELPSLVSIKLRMLALKDENPVVRLEAENIKEAKEAPPKPDEAAIDALIEQLASENQLPPNEDPFRGERRVLVVDDSKTVQHIMKESLSPHATVGQALSSSEALTLVEKDPYDIIFLDISMPDKSGLDLLGELRDRGVKSAIILMSSLDSRHIIQTAFLLGANYFISKNKMAKILKTDKLREILRRF
jgi:CheY-like chemotaxis protein